MPKNDPRDEILTEKPKSKALIVTVYIVSTVLLFVFGCFVLGPVLSRMHSARTRGNQTVSEAKSPSVSEPPSIDSSATHRPRAKVTISEKPSSDSQSDPAVSDVSSASETPAAIDETPVADDSLSDDQSLQYPDSPPVETDEPASKPETPTLYRVRAGIFASRTNADALSAKLVSAGFAPAIYQVQRENTIMFSVQLGAFKRRESANKLASSLRKAGFEATITTDK